MPNETTQTSIQLKDSAWLDSIWSIVLPVVSAMLVIGTLPPINFWVLGFISIAPIYLFIKINMHSSWQRISLGGFIFSFIFSTFLMSQTVLQFHWIKEAYLFSTIVKLAFIPILVAMSLFSSCSILFLRYTLRYIQERIYKDECFKSEFLSILTAALVWTISEWIIKKGMFNIEYSIIGYPAHNTFFVSLASVGGVFLTVFFVALINMSIGSFIYHIYKYRTESKTQKGFYFFAYTQPSLAPLLMICLTFGTTFAIYKYDSYLLSSTSVETKTLKIATIQDQDRTGETFGKEVNGHFHFKTLEDLIQKANSASPDIIIYPFAPWDGVIYDKKKDTKDIPLFNKNVFATSFETFGEWENTYVASGTIFATWATTYRDGNFYNEITFWKNGVLLGVHQKEYLFPFLDYTPKFAQSRGLYTTAVDGIPGTSTLKEKIGGVQMGALVCSEVTHPVEDSTSRYSDLILSIGSEAFFTSGVAGDLNVANASYRAAESGKPVIRANRFGPSAFIDQTGKTIAYMPYGVTGVLVSDITIPIKNQKPFYFRP